MLPSAQLSKEQYLELWDASLFNEENKLAILNQIQQGVPYSIAAKSYGVAPKIFNKWIERGEYELENGVITQYAEFVVQLNKVEAEQIKYYLGRMHGKNWHYLAWKLAKLWPRYFGAESQEMQELKDIFDQLQSKRANGETYENISNAETVGRES